MTNATVSASGKKASNNLPFYSVISKKTSGAEFSIDPWDARQARDAQMRSFSNALVQIANTNVYSLGAMSEQSDGTWTQEDDEWARNLEPKEESEKKNSYLKPVVGAALLAIGVLSGASSAAFSTYSENPDQICFANANGTNILIEGKNLSSIPCVGTYTEIYDQLACICDGLNCTQQENSVKYTFSEQPIVLNDEMLTYSDFRRDNTSVPIPINYFDCMKQAARHGGDDRVGVNLSENKLVLSDTNGIPFVEIKNPTKEEKQVKVSDLRSRLFGVIEAPFWLSEPVDWANWIAEGAILVGLGLTGYYQVSHIKKKFEIPSRVMKELKENNAVSVYGLCNKFNWPYTVQDGYNYVPSFEAKAIEAHLDKLLKDGVVTKSSDFYYLVSAKSKK